MEHFEARKNKESIESLWPPMVATDGLVKIDNAKSPFAKIDNDRWALLSYV